jgi:hypothetical protein
VSGVAAARSAGLLKGASASAAAKLDVSKPVTALVSLFGTVVVEEKQRAALETAIIAGDQPIDELLDLLVADLHGLQLIDEASYESMQTGKINLYASIRDKTAPKDIPTLIDQFAQDMANMQTLQSLQLDSLLGDVKSAHTALVVFAKSSKSPKDLSDLSAQIDVLTQHVQLIQNAISSIQTVSHSTK